MNDCTTCLYFKNCEKCRSGVPEYTCKDYRNAATGERNGYKLSEHDRRKAVEHSLCWNCPNMKCSWMLYRIPVKGWKAKRTTIDNHHENRRLTPSYKVIECPKYTGKE